MTEADKKKIAEIMKRHGVVVGYLFGSAARGTMVPHSDIDVAVLFDEKKVPQEKQFNEKLAISHDITKEFNIKDADVINLATARSPLLKISIIGEEPPLIVLDGDLRFSLERSIIQEYEDTKFLHLTAVKIMREQLDNGTFGKPLVRSV